MGLGIYREQKKSGRLCVEVKENQLVMENKTVNQP